MCNSKEFAITFDAIPAELLMLLRGDSRRQLNVHFVANLMLDGINSTDTTSAKLLWNSKFIGINWNSVWTSGSFF